MTVHAHDEACSRADVFVRCFQLRAAAEAERQTSKPMVTNQLRIASRYPAIGPTRLGEGYLQRLGPNRSK